MNSPGQRQEDSSSYHDYDKESNNESETDDSDSENDDPQSSTPPDPKRVRKSPKLFGDWVRANWLYKTPDHDEEQLAYFYSVCPLTEFNVEESTLDSMEATENEQY